MTKQPTYFVGIDIASESFHACLLEGDSTAVLASAGFDNQPSGFSEFCRWLEGYNVRCGNSAFCMENTGVYSERLAHFLLSHNFMVCVEDARRVKRGFPIQGHKNDPIDAKHIAEYARRFFDKLKCFVAKPVILQQVSQMLTLREQLVKQSTGLKNIRTAQKRRETPDRFVEETVETVLSQLKQQIQGIEKRIKQVLELDPQLQQQVECMDSIPSVGSLLASNFLEYSSTQKELKASKATAYVGISPYEHRSGKDVYRKKRSSGAGPKRMRKLLHLAARSAVVHDEQMREYYLRKQGEGKSKKLVLNNVANKIVKRMCAVLNSNSHYIPNYRSVRPLLIKNA
jgi:transposase